MDKEIIGNSAHDKSLEIGAKQFEMFCLRPKRMANVETLLRMKINSKWDGWRLKDELVKSLGLEVGDTINAEVSILNSPGLINDKGNTDLFASGPGADWLLENDVGFGSIIDAKVRFVYAQAPVGGREGKDIWKISLVFVEGISVIKSRSDVGEHIQLDKNFFSDSLRRILSDQ